MKNIIINNLSIKYDDLLVIDDLSIQFTPGLHLLQGYNGSGKSSLLKGLCGIIEVKPGTVFIMNCDISRQPLQAKKHLCFVADKPEIYPFMTGIQYLSLIAKIKGATLSSELYAWLDKINLSQFMDIEFSQMSFGTRRKFALSSCLLADPDVILLDEPFNGLDNNTVEHFTQLLLQWKTKKCIVVASHNTHVLALDYDSVLNLA
jgi:ABC-type multidrug transport system ATPase subunit